MCIAQTVDIFATGLVAGALVISRLAIQPAAERLDPSAHLVFRQQLIHRLSKLMPPLMLLPILACIGAIAFCQASVFWPIDVFGGVLSLATITITVAVSSPLNWRFAQWSSVAPPSNWQKYIRIWNAAHSLRTTTALAAFVCAIVAPN